MPNPHLSIVIACYNDNAECLETVKSIYATAGKALAQFEIEIVIVDDASTRPVCQDIPVSERYTHVTHWRNDRKIGCGPSRYVGACFARGEWLLFTDSHMRFTPGWYETWKSHSGMAVNTIYCGSCLVLDHDSMNPEQAKAAYFGATWRFYAKDKDPHKEVFECIWRKDDGATAADINEEIPACMGAIYFCNRQYFLKLNALRHLAGWGGDEQELSLKYWLSGGSVRLIRQVRVGHKFRIGKLSKINPIDPLYNKLFIIHSCLAPYLAKRLEDRFHVDGWKRQARQRLLALWHLVEAERAYNSTIFSVRFEDYIARFGLVFPS